MQVIHQIQLKSTSGGSRLRKVPMIVVGGNRVWVANGPNIHIISAKVCHFVAYCFSNFFNTGKNRHFSSPIKYLPNYMHASTSKNNDGLGCWCDWENFHLGCTGIFNYLVFKVLKANFQQTQQKCHQFTVHQQSCAQSMALLNNYIWMAVGKDILVVNSKVSGYYKLSGLTYD